MRNRTLFIAALALTGIALAGCSSMPSDPVEAAAVSAAQAYLNDGDKDGGDSACADFRTGQAYNLPEAKSLKVAEVVNESADTDRVQLTGTDDDGDEFTIRVWVDTAADPVCAFAINDEG